MYDHDTKLTPEKRAEMIAAIPQRIDGMMAADPWMKFFLTYDPGATMRRVKTPVLILTGANDKQAVPEQVAVQEKAFKEGGNKDVTARVLPGLNHLFVEDADGFPGNYAKLPQPLVMRADVLTDDHRLACETAQMMRKICILGIPRFRRKHTVIQMSDPNEQLLSAFDGHDVDAVRAALDAGADACSPVRGKLPIYWLLEEYHRTDRLPGLPSTAVGSRSGYERPAARAGPARRRRRDQKGF